MIYTPSQEILDKYADLLVKYALNNGKGIRKNEVVFLQVPESAKPLLISLQKSVLKSGAHAIIQYLPDGVMKDFFDLASPEQISFFPAKFLKGKVNEAHHMITILAETDLHELEGIDPQKLMDKNRSMKPYFDWRQNKESKNKFSWTLASYATPAMAKEAGLSLKQCWQQIIRACYLNEIDPIQKWQQISKDINKIIKKLDTLKIKKLHLVSTETDIFVGLDQNRKWRGGSGNNIPSFEIFISPDWRQTEGKIYFNQPLYYQGNIIKDIRLTFSKGKIIESSARVGEKILKEMINVENADKIGEFSLTDKRFSKINRFMAETLFDENFGGEFGNTHLAIGTSFHECFPGNIAKVTKEDWDKMGYNNSSIHTDIISTLNRKVTAILEDDSEVLIYHNGKFTL